jgi:hypothetical protein
LPNSIGKFGHKNSANIEGCLNFAPQIRQNTKTLASYKSLKQCQVWEIYRNTEVVTFGGQLAEANDCLEGPEAISCKK